MNTDLNNERANESKVPEIEEKPARELSAEELDRVTGGFKKSGPVHVGQ
jgi:hypothetical protein